MTETRGGYTDAGDPLLEQLAQRLEGDPNYMASVLEAYRRQEGKSRDAQQQQLGLSRLAFVRLALCRRPDADQATFRAQVEEIARYTGATPASLVQLIRQVDALASMDARTLDHGAAPSTRRPACSRAHHFGYDGGTRSHCRVAGDVQFTQAVDGRRRCR